MKVKSILILFLMFSSSMALISKQTPFWDWIIIMSLSVALLMNDVRKSEGDPGSLRIRVERIFDQYSKCVYADRMDLLRQRVLVEINGDDL